MNSLQNMAHGLMKRVGFLDKTMTEPEILHGTERPMTGFIATLTPEQKERAFGYRGPENHGDEAFSKS